MNLPLVEILLGTQLLQATAVGRPLAHVRSDLRVAQLITVLEMQCYKLLYSTVTFLTSLLPGFYTDKLTVVMLTAGLVWSNKNRLYGANQGFSLHAWDLVLQNYSTGFQRFFMVTLAAEFYVTWEIT